MPLIGDKPCWASLSLSKLRGKIGVVGLVGNVGIMVQSDKIDKDRERLIRY